MRHTTFGLHSSLGNQFLVFYFIHLYTWLLLRRFFPHQLFLLQGYPRPGGEHFQTQTGHRMYTNPSSLELSSENIYITTTTKRLRKRSLYAISLSGSCAEELSCQGSTGRPACTELRYACKRQSLEKDTCIKPKKEISPKQVG